MAEARSRERWAHTSALLALIANVHRDHRKKPSPYKPADFNPHLRRREPPVRKAPIEVLKQVFVDRR
jgi:hypothetical protein